VASCPNKRHAAPKKKPLELSSSGFCIGAGNEARTRDLNLGKVALYQLSYSRVQFEMQAGIVEELGQHFCSFKIYTGLEAALVKLGP
jgi:hypothetical protein